MKIIDNTDEYFVVSTNVSFDDEILNIVKTMDSIYRDFKTC